MLSGLTHFWGSMGSKGDAGAAARGRERCAGAAWAGLRMAQAITTREVVERHSFAIV
jgi:hypothetical protein